jgi:hypothetical protein
MLVQNIAIILLIILVGYAFYDFKKAILIWIPFKLLFNDQVAVRYESPGMSLVVAGDLALIAVYYLRGEKNDLWNAPFLFKKPMIAFAISYAISTIFTVAPYQTALIATIKYFASGFCMLFLLQKSLKRLDDVKLFVKCCAIVGFLIVLLAISENILRTNIWLDFLSYNSPFDISSGRMFYVSGRQQMRYGLVQCFSFFSFHVPFGFACICLYWITYYFSKFAKYQWNSKWLVIVSWLLLVGAIMSLSKQAYLGLFLMILSLYPLSTVFNIKAVLPIVVIFVVVMIYFPEYTYNIISLSDEQLAEEGGGSTIALREKQYDIALQMFKESPLFGNGVASIEYLKRFGYEEILGAESTWLRILPERGLLGAFTYLYLYTYLWQFKKFINHKILFFFLLSIFVVENAGGIKDISIWGTVLLIVYRYNEIKCHQLNASKIK